MNKNILIHTAMKHEAKPIIEHFKLQCIQTKPYKIYAKENIFLIVSGMGEEKTALHVNDVFKKYEINKALNIGIAGCLDESIEIGSIFCTNHKLDFIKHASLTTVDKPCENARDIDSTLVDMEAKSFLHVSQKYLHVDNIYVLKIVSDYLDTTIPEKEFVWKIIKKNLKSISLIVTTKN